MRSRAGSIHHLLSMAEAFDRLNITCCSQRITDLRKDYDIVTTFKTSHTGARYARWSIKGKK
ncbi:MAG: hypothetical protein EBS50_12280 [Sphingomonadaceae bacterium]|nr:hypothetical protein [Sphingomonadaceae bacterium]